VTVPVIHGKISSPRGIDNENPTQHHDQLKLCDIGMVWRLARTK
jgi:hypothetical protein